MKPINIVLVVITVIEALRAFDIVYIINRGRNGLELLSVLITDNIIGEASRIGYGSAIAVVLLDDLGRPDRDLRLEQLPGGAEVMTSAAVDTGATGDGAASRPRRRKRRRGPARIALHAVPDPDGPALGRADPVGDLHRDAAVLGHVRRRLRRRGRKQFDFDNFTNAYSQSADGCTTSGTR